MAQLLSSPRIQAIDANGNPVVGALLYTYNAGTTTPRVTYSDAALSTPNANPMVADSAGRFGPVYVQSATATAVKLSVFTSTGTLIFEQDNVPTIPLTANEIGLVFYPRSTAEISSSVTPTAYQYEGLPVVDIRRYGYVADGTTDNVPAFDRAISVAGALGGAIIQLPPGVGRIASSVVIASPNILFRGCGKKATIVRAAAATFNLFVPRADYVGFQSMGFHGVASATGEQWGIFTAVANPASYLSVRDCYFGGSTSTARLNDAIKFDEGCNYGLVDDCIVDQMQGIDSGGGYGILAGAVTRLRINNVLGFGDIAEEQGRHLVYLSTGATHCVVSNCYGIDWTYETFTMNSLSTHPANAWNIFENCIAVGGNPDNATTGSFSVFGTSRGNIFRNCVAIDPGQKGFLLIARSDATDCDAEENVFDNCMSIGAGAEGLDIQGSSRTKVIGGRYVDSSQLSAGVSANIRLVSTASGGQAVTGCELIGVTADGTSANCALQLNPTSPEPTGVRIRAPRFGPGDSGVGGLVVNSSTVPWDGAKGGTATIDSATTSVVVTHLLGLTPTAAQLAIVATENPTNDPGNLWISGISSTEFTINCRSDPGASNLDIAWQYNPQS